MLCYALMCREMDLCYCGFDFQSHSEEAINKGKRDPKPGTLEFSFDESAVLKREALGILPSRNGLRPVKVRATLRILTIIESLKRVTLCATCNVLQYERSFTWIQYARFAPSLSKDVLHDLLFKEWKLKKPNFLISISAREVPSSVAASVARVRTDYSLPPIIC